MVEMAEKKLYEYNVDDHMRLLVLIKSANVRTAKNGKDFLALTFEDKSGEMEGMYWGVTPAEVAAFKTGKVVELQAIRQVYQGKPQLKILKINMLSEQSAAQPADFMIGSPVNRHEMEHEINELLFSITNPTWNRIVRYLLQKYHDQFYSFPAAKKNHHAFTGGLAFHTLSIVHLAQDFVKRYPEINEGLLLAGALLHDIGKTVELSGPVGTTYTTAGNLIGHITIADTEIVLASQALNIDSNSEDVLLLRHVVLAHHGLLEYGSPVRPAILEAEVLHKLDDLDATIQMFKQAVKHTEPGNFSERIFALDQRMIYQPRNKPEK